MRDDVALCSRSSVLLPYRKSLGEIMVRLLNVQSSPNLKSSASRSASKAYIERYVAAYPGTVVTDLDLVLNPPSHLGTEHLGAFFAPPEFHTPESAAALRSSEAYLEQFFAADVIVVGTPMHNLCVTSVLKSWIDNILRICRTFKYGDQGQVVGLVSGNKKVVIVIAAGGLYSVGPFVEMDHASTYLTAIFNFMGISDVSVVWAEGMNMGPEMATRGLANAWASAHSLVDSELAAPDIRAVAVA